MNNDSKTGMPGAFDFNLNLGDANAINGGIHTTSNNDSHNVTTNNYINQFDRPKTESEIEEEKKKSFISSFKEICPSGYISDEDAWKLKQKAWNLGISWDTAENIIKVEQEILMHSMQQLDSSDLELLSGISAAVDSCDEKTVKMLYPYLGSMLAKSSDEKIQFYFYLITAALYPEKIVDDSKLPGNISNSFWKMFWKGQALRVRGCNDESLACYRACRFMTQGDQRKLLLLDCLYNATMPEEMLNFRLTAIQRFGDLMSMDLSYTSNLICALGYFLKQFEIMPGAEFYIKYFFSSDKQKESGPFQLPKMLKIKPL